MSNNKPALGGRAKKNTAVTLIRSSAAEYLTFVAASGQGGVEAVYADENVWLTQKMMGLLYDVETHTINYHLKKAFADHELAEDSVIRNFRITAADGKSYDTQHYNLPAIIAVGYKVNSERAVQFRKWATGIIESFTIKGYAMDDERLKNDGSITTEGQVIDVFTAAGLPKPDISILSDQFLAEVRGLKHKNVAAELLEKLLKDELKVRSRRNVVQSQVFSDKLKQTLNAYHNRAISTMQVIEELIKLAKDLDAATKRGEALGLTEDEVAFYDALAANASAVMAMGDVKLKVIAAELISQVRKSVTIDWTLREGARARIRVMVKRILNKYGYPPDLQDEAVKTVLAQAELLSAGWAEV